MLLFFVLGLFLPAGTWMWTKDWLFILVIVVASILGTLYLRRVNPEVIAARISRHKGTKRWDRILLAIFLLTVMAMPSRTPRDGSIPSRDQRASSARSSCSNGRPCIEYGQDV